MVFKKTVNGEVDTDINTSGRPLKGDGTKKLTNRQIREKEFLSLARKFKPLQAAAISTASKIMQNEESSDMNRLKASALIIATYQDLLKDVYDKDYDAGEGADEIQQGNKAPLFSLTMVKNGKAVKPDN